MNLADYLSHVASYDTVASTWNNRGNLIVKRYEDERPVNSRKARFNILWSNVQTLAPALYDRQPTPNIERRNQDDDDLGRVTSEVLERCANYFIKNDSFNDVMNQAVLDRLLPGRGTAWVRYVPNFKDAEVTGNEEVRAEGVQVSDTVIIGDEVEQELYSEDVAIDFINRIDFGHNVARTWSEVFLVWRKAYLSRKELIERFPGVGENIPLDAKAADKKDTSDSNKKATIYEAWNKLEKKVVWFHKEYPKMLDERPDPLRLKGFFPCPKPIYATLTNDSLIPTPDYVQYQDQATELDILTGRITSLTAALRIVGVYDASAQGLQKLLTDPGENKLVPVDSWAMFAQAGGLKGSIDFIPIDQVAAVLTGLYAARDKTKQDIYEITGISDIIRGASNPNETLGAQELKGKYAGLRLGAMQRDVARFSRDLVEFTVEIVAEHFDLETIKQISGYKLLTNAQKQEINMLLQQYQQLAAQAQQMQQPAPQPPVDKKTMALMKLPSWEDVEALIRTDMPRCFLIDIETDSTIKADQDSEKASRIEFLGAVGGFLKEAAAVQDPALKPVLMEMLMFGVRGFKAGREMESVFKNAIEDMREQYEQQPQQPQPTPDEIAAQQDAKMKAELGAAELELKKTEMQNKSILSEKELGLKERELQIKDKQIDADMKKALLDAKTKVSADVAMFDDDMNEGKESPMVGLIVSALQQQAQTMNDGLQQIAMMNLQSNQAVIEAITKPKVTTLIRDPKTKELIGSEQRAE